MGGDPPGAGDHPDAKPVFDFDTIALLKAATSMNHGTDFMGKALKGSPHYTHRRGLQPGASDLDKEIARMEEKVNEGAEFFQTQAVYEVGRVREVHGAREGLRQAGASPASSSSSPATWRGASTNRCPASTCPTTLIKEMDAAEDKSAKSIEIGGRIISQIKGMCQGVHVMAIGWESRIPAMLQAGGISQHG